MYNQNKDLCFLHHMKLFCPTEEKALNERSYRRERSGYSSGQCGLDFARTQIEYHGKYID